MPLLALDPLWNDIYAAGGFWIGLISFIVGVIAFIIAIVQLKEARNAALASKEAAEAARDAARATLAESKEAFERFVAAHAGRLLSEVQTAVKEVNWEMAELRARDLAEIISTLPTTGNSEMDGKMAEAVKQLREFGHTFADLGEKKAKRLPPAVAKTQWKPLLDVLNTRLDQLRAPFRELSHGEDRTDDPAGKAVDDRSEPAGKD